MTNSTHNSFFLHVYFNSLHVLKVPLSCNVGTLTSWNPLGHSRPVTGLLYLFTCFEQPRAHHQENQLYQYNFWYMSLCISDRPVCRSGKNWSSFPTWTPDAHLHRLTYTGNSAIPSRLAQRTATYTEWHIPEILQFLPDLHTGRPLTQSDIQVYQKLSIFFPTCTPDAHLHRGTYTRNSAIPSRPAHRTATYTEWHTSIPEVVHFLPDLHTKRSPTQSDIYQKLYRYIWFSWRWARGCSKHVEDWNKHKIKKNCASSWSFTRINFVLGPTYPYQYFKNLFTSICD
jgi:hypothetical protein